MSKKSYSILEQIYHCPMCLNDSQIQIIDVICRNKDYNHKEYVCLNCNKELRNENYYRFYKNAKHIDKCDKCNKEIITYQCGKPWRMDGDQMRIKCDCNNLVYIQFDYEEIHYAMG